MVPAVHAAEHVDAAIADQEVLVGGAGDVLDAAEMIRDRPVGNIVRARRYSRARPGRWSARP